MHNLASALDDITDFMWGAARQMHNYHLLVPGEATVVFSKQMHILAKQLGEALRELRDTERFPGLGLLLREMSLSTAKMSVIVDDALIEGYSTRLGGERARVSQDFRDVVKKKDHYEMLQQIVFRAQATIRMIEVIVVKYG
jgi:hypothetical protein